MKLFAYTVLGFFLFVPFFSFVHNASAATSITADISEDTLWTASSSPYIVGGNIEIKPEATLTIEPGVVIKMTKGGLVIYGKLDVQGTEAEPVYFTSYNDDSVGDDSNGDGVSTLPARGDWRGIRFQDGSIGNFNHAVIRYAGYGYSNTLRIPSIYNQGGDVTITDSEFTQSETCAFAQTSGSSSMSNTKIENHTICGTAFFGGDMQLHNNSISNSNIGAFVNGTGTVEFVGNVFEDNSVSSDVTLTNELSFTHSGNTASGSEYNGFIIRGSVQDEVTLVQDSMPYIIVSFGGSLSSGELRLATASSLRVKSTGLLTIEPGVVVKFGRAAAINVDGIFKSQGTQQSPVRLTSLKDDSVGGDDNGDAAATLPAAGDWLHLQFNEGSSGIINNTIITYGGYRYTSSVRGHSLANIYNNGGVVQITASEIAYGNLYGLRNKFGTSTINQSSIHDNAEYGVINVSQLPIVDARNNYWGDPSGPYHSTLNPAGLGNKVSDNVLFQPWKGVFCTENCFSNVLFLPGIQASRLYKDGLLGTKDQVWPPNSLFNNDVSDLRMDTSGVSEEEIYTSDVIDTSVGVGDVYGGFEQFLNELMFDGIIENWTPFAYDWRYGVTDIAQNGTQYEEGLRSALEEAKYLAANSFSGKVTIMGHSNGGLLAKAIMQGLEDEGKSNIVDKVIFLASPQLGTPKAIGTILHGYDQTDALGGIIINAQNAREIINNLPGAYGLLPSEDYFNGLNEPLVTFTDSVSTAPYRVVYGSSISNYADYVNFIRGEDGLGRDIQDPASMPARANGTMLDDALIMHNTHLDDWVAPEGIEVIEIVGTGLPTMKSVEYRENTEDKCTTAGLICTPEAEMKPYAILTKYGDETVLQRSAEGYKGAERKYFFNLKSFNESVESQGGQPVFHYNITEAQPVQELLSNILISTTTENNQFISTSYTEFNDEYDFEIIDSPVRLLSTDTDGNQTGVIIVDGVAVIKEEIPGSQYFEFGDTKYFVVPKGTDRTTKLYGEDYGGYTLTIASLNSSDTQNIETVLVNATSTPELISEYSNTNGEFSTVTTDINGDGVIDYESTLEGEILEDEPVVTYALLMDSVQALNVSGLRAHALLLLLKKAEHYAYKTPSKKSYRKLEDTFLKIAQKLIKQYTKKRYITETEAKTLNDQIEVLKDKQ